MAKRFLPLIGLLALVHTGCSTIVYRAETVLTSDGKIHRAIGQPVDETPGEILNPKTWEQVTFAEQDNNKDKDFPPLTTIPIHSRDEKHRYFVAWKTFNSVGEMPDHVRYGWEKLPSPTSGKLKRQYSKNDCLFVVEHSWKETLTDVVSYPDFRVARMELADLMIQLGQEIVEEMFGQEYDSGGLVEWFQSEGKTWWAELTDTLYVGLAGGKNKMSEDRLTRELATICERHGLKLWDNQGGVVQGEELSRRIEAYAAGLILKHGRRKDGKPLDLQKALKLLKEVTDGKPKPIPGQKGEKSPFETASQQVITRKYGSKEAFEQKTGPLVVRVVGLYLLDPGIHHFDYVMTVPGDVVRTNGQLLANNKVHWEFSVQEAFPLGYPMECEALEAKTSLQQTILGGTPLKERKDMMAYVAFVRDRQDMLALLRECEKQKSTKPLMARHKDLLEKKNLPMPLQPANVLGELATVQQLLKVLKIEVEEKGL